MVDAIQSHVPTVATDRLLPPQDVGDGSFRQMLESAKGSISERPAPFETGDRGELRAAATALVASAFIVPMLQSLREQPMLEGGLFAPGTAERRFGPLLDEKIADRLTAGAALPLVDTIVDHMIRISMEGSDDRA